MSSTASALIDSVLSVKPVLVDGTPFIEAWETGRDPVPGGTLVSRCMVRWDAATPFGTVLTEAEAEASRTRRAADQACAAPQLSEQQAACQQATQAAEQATYRAAQLRRVAQGCAAQLY